MTEIQVILNVYDLKPEMNQTCYNIGLGLYHSGIQLGLHEYTFGSHQGTHTGVMQLAPKVNHPNFRQSISLGKTKFTFRQINSVLDVLRQKFTGNSYHIIRKNCNTFTNCFCQAILQKSIPGYVNRLANFGKVFLQIDDFIRMRPYTDKYQTSANQLGVILKDKKDPFNSSQGVIIG